MSTSLENELSDTYNQVLMQNNRLTQQDLRKVTREQATTNNQKILYQQQQTETFSTVNYGLVISHYIVYLVMMVFLVWKKLRFPDKLSWTFIVVLGIVLGAFPFTILVVELILWNACVWLWQWSNGNPFWTNHW